MPGCRIVSWNVTWIICCSIALLLAACTKDSGSPPAATPGQPAKVTTAARYYVVKRGDTLFGIGSKNGHRYRQLAAWNHILPPYTIYPGQKIRLFGPAAAALSKAHAKTSDKASIKRKTTASGRVESTFSTSKEKRSRPSAEEKSKKKVKVYWQWPLKGVIARSYSETGSKGIDISGTPGQPVRAAAAGKVVYSGEGLVGYGNLVIVKHSEKYLSAYANNRRLLVQQGDQVRKGQTIAEVGAAAGKGPSLHFEIRKYGKSVNPIPYLPKD